MLLYIDPGAGSMVIQGLLAFALAIPFFFRAQVGRVMRRFRRPQSRNAEQDER
ncbi:MAG: hypothetical protein ACRDGD_02450 [Candidatus Limnocylindria bacterium]